MLVTAIFDFADEANHRIFKDFVENEFLQVSKFRFNQELKAVIRRSSIQVGVHKKCTNVLKHCYKGVHINSLTHKLFREETKHDSVC